MSGGDHSVVGRPPRMKNLGTISSITDTENFLSDHGVTNGTFIDIELGDYVTIQDGTYNKKWIVAGLDWHNNKLYNPHLLTLWPAKSLMSTAINNTSTVVSYKNSTINNALYTMCTNLQTVLGDRMCHVKGTTAGDNISISGSSMYGANTQGYTGSFNYNNDSNPKAIIPSIVEFIGYDSGASSQYDTMGETICPLFQIMPVWYWLGENFSGNDSIWTRTLSYVETNVSNFNILINLYQDDYTYSNFVSATPCNQRCNVMPFIFLK